jgi:hypothetical protein
MLLLAVYAPAIDLMSIFMFMSYHRLLDLQVTEQIHPRVSLVFRILGYSLTQHQRFVKFTNFASNGDPASGDVQ